MLAGWDKNEAGNIRLDPLVRFQTAHLHEIGVGLRLELSSGPGAPQTPGFVPQVAMSVEHAQSLIQELQKTVDYILTRPSPERAH
jgi:hypothetical protein